MVLLFRLFLNPNLLDLAIVRNSENFYFWQEFMGRPIRVARSKRYLREQTKVDIQSQSAPSESNPEGE